MFMDTVLNKMCFRIVIGICLLSPPALCQVGLHVRWEHLGPLPTSGDEESGSRLQLRLVNRGSNPLTPAGWSIFVSSAHMLHAAAGTPLVIEHLGGDFQRLRPSSAFKVLAPGQFVNLDLFTQSPLTNVSTAPTGAYLVENFYPTRVHTVAEEVILPFGRKRNKQEAARVLATRYDQNAAIQDIPLEDLPPVFPTPAFMEQNAGELNLSAMPSIQAPAELASEAGLLEAYLCPWFKSGSRQQKTRIQLGLGEVEGVAGPEAYLLTIRPEGIQVLGRTAAGVFYGLQTLRDLLPAAPDGGGLRLQALNVKDAPRFGYRGLHLDVARNFQPKATVLRVLDLMAQYKLNTFHFHLTDDEGWRLKIPGLPELTSVGGRRGHTLTADRWLPPAYGSGPQPGRPFGSGFYSRKDYQQILRHAQRLHIEVIPELEMPGHARAAIKAMEARYRRLSQQGSAAAASQFRLVDPEDTSVYTSAQTYHDNVMNPALPSTFAFISKVIQEVVTLHREADVPLRHLHVGGDEVPAGVWERSPQVQVLLNARGWPSVASLWPEFYRRVDGILSAHGLPVSGWEEIALQQVQAGDKAQQIVNPEFSGRGWRTYVWNNVPGWGNEDLAYKLANAGYSVVLCLVTNLYFDLAASPDPEEPGLQWGGFTDLDKPFDCIPQDYYRSTRQDHLARPLDPKVFDGKIRLSEAGRGRILGIQGCLWSETLVEEGRLETMLVPNLLGLAERAWAPDPAWAAEPEAGKAAVLHQADWSRFLVLGKRALPRLARGPLPVRFRIPAPGLKVEAGRVRFNLAIPGFALRYTLDGTDPTSHSPLVTGELPAKGVIKVAAFDASGRKGRIVSASL